MSIDPILLASNPSQDQDMTPQDLLEDNNFFGPNQDLIPPQENWSDEVFRVLLLERGFNPPTWGVWEKFHDIVETWPAAIADEW